MRSKRRNEYSLCRLGRGRDESECRADRDAYRMLSFPLIDSSQAGHKTGESRPDAAPTSASPRLWRASATYKICLWSDGILLLQQMSYRQQIESRSVHSMFYLRATVRLRSTHYLVTWLDSLVEHDSLDEKGSVTYNSKTIVFTNPRNSFKKSEAAFTVS